jgi:hypothetical protein
MAEESDRHPNDLAITLAKGAEEIVASIRGQVEQMGEEFDAARINALRPSPEVMERLRAKVEAGLLGAFDKGAVQAIDAIERSTQKPSQE